MAVNSRFFLEVDQIASIYDKSNPHSAGAMCLCKKNIHISNFFD